MVATTFFRSTISIMASPPFRLAQKIPFFHTLHLLCNTRASAEGLSKGAESKGKGESKQKNLVKSIAKELFWFRTLEDPPTVAVTI